MTVEFLKENDKRLAQAIISTWMKSGKQTNLDDALKIFDRLSTIELRSAGTTHLQLHTVVSWMEKNGLQEHNRVNEIRNFIKELPTENKIKESEKENLLAIATVASGESHGESLKYFIQPRGYIVENPSYSPWKSVEAKEKASFLEQVSPIDGRYKTNEETTLLSYMSLPWYRNFALIRVVEPLWLNKNMAIYYLTNAGNLFRLNGTSPPIHEVNKKAPIELTESNVLDYLRFFCFFVRGDEGPFYILEDIEDPLLTESLEGPSYSILEDSVQSAKYLGRNDKGAYICEAIVFYSNAIFNGNFVIETTGMISLVNDTPLAGDLPVKINQPIA